MKIASYFYVFETTYLNMLLLLLLLLSLLLLLLLS